MKKTLFICCMTVAFAGMALLTSCKKDKSSITYTVTFNANGGTGTMENQTFTDAVAQTLTANNFTKTNYTFAGWATSADGNVVYSNEQSITITANTTLYAQWTVINPLIGKWENTKMGNFCTVTPSPIPEYIIEDIRVIINDVSPDFLKTVPLTFNTFMPEEISTLIFTDNKEIYVIEPGIGNTEELLIGTYTYDNEILSIKDQNNEYYSQLPIVIENNKFTTTFTEVETLRKYVDKIPELKEAIKSKLYYSRLSEYTITTVRIEEYVRQ